MFKFNPSIIKSAEDAYDNKSAHEELKSMMNHHDRLNMFFDIDEYGYAVIKVESKSTSRFSYQLSETSYNWIMNYLISGQNEDFGIDPLDLSKSEMSNGNDYRKEALKSFIGIKNFNLQFTPEFRDKRGQLTAVANFKYGNIFFFIKRDKDIVSFLQEKEVIR